MRPFYAARVSDLGPDDPVHVECGCGHEDWLTAAIFGTAGVATNELIRDLQRRLKCKSCRWKGRAAVSIKWADDG
jgi:hypothetical protein